MLGQVIHDPDGLEGKAGSSEGLGLLDVTTQMTPEKSLSRVSALYGAHNLVVDGYEIHIGCTTGLDCQRPFAMIDQAPDGAQSQDGRVKGTYLHGLFSNDQFRRHFLNDLELASTSLGYEQTIDETLDALAAHIQEHMAIDQLLAL